jgi:hypothetical protein
MKSSEHKNRPTSHIQRSAFSKARYKKTGIPKWDGNPLIEALPRLPDDLADFSDFVEQSPPLPTDATRRKSEMQRLTLLSDLEDIVYSFLEYEKASSRISRLIRNSYVSRNPVTRTDVQRRHAIATKGSDGVQIPRNWRSTAKGLLMIAVTGMGKTTFRDAFLQRVPQLIEHRSYNGKRLHLRQIVYICLDVPHDGTLRSVCYQFFRKVDKILGTRYKNRAVGLRNIARWSN